MTDWVLSYRQAREAESSIVGGKGWNLARLHELGFQVPAGGVLIAAAYDQFRAQGTLPEEVATAVRAFLAEHLDNRPLAIRSSATAEDNADDRSVLDVRGPDAVLEAIVACYRSTETRCAVVLCEMVPSIAAAGVAFSADPRTGRRDRSIVHAASGRGDGGRTTAEEVVIHNGVERSEVVRRQGPWVLSEAQYLALGRLVARVEWALGEGQQPQDVEWVFDGQRFWLVQARPITNLPRVTVPLAAGQPALWSNGNLKDAVAGVPTTITWSFVAPFLNAIFFAPIERLGYPIPPGMDIIRRFEGRAYLDLASLQAVYFDALGSMPADAARALGGPQDQIVVPPVTRSRTARWQRARLRALVLLIRQRRSYPSAIQKMRRAARAFPADLRGYSVRELMEMAERIGRLQMEFGPHFQIGNFDGGAWYEPLEQTIERWLPGQGRRLAAALMADRGQVVSAEHGYQLFELARAAAADPAAQDFLDRQDWQAALPDGPFRQAMHRFLDEFGHRGIYEAELANPRWSEDPGFIFDQVRRIVADGGPSRPDAPARERRQLAERALSRLPLPRRIVVRWLASQSAGAAARREAGKSALIAMALPVRRLLLEFGRRLVEQGVLESVNDMFHLARADLEAFARGEWDGRGAGALVEERRQLRAVRLAAAPPPDLIVSEPASRTAPMPSAPAVSPGDALHGMAASPGRAHGPARLILHPDQADRLQRGDVLVAPSTDPGWTPLFLRCAAVVTEVGGYLSHGAIVAREFGLPAVINVPRVMDLLVDGELVTVDGDAGLVVRDSKSTRIAEASATTGDALPARP